MQAEPAASFLSVRLFAELLAHCASGVYYMYAFMCLFYARLIDCYTKRLKG